MRYVDALRLWGEGRYTEGAAPTEFHFTGQRELAALGLLAYGARWYDNLLISGQKAPNPTGAHSWGHNVYPSSMKAFLLEGGETRLLAPRVGWGWGWD
jgi:hypothetical protein